MSETQTLRAATLGKSPLFSGLTESELGFLLERVASPKFSSGETVVTEGEPCAGLYVVESGSTRIFKSSAGGREQILNIEGPGASFAELPLFDGGSYPASAAAIEDSVLLLVSKQDFQELCLNSSTSCSQSITSRRRTLRGRR